MSWPSIFTGPVATSLPGGWTGRLQSSITGYSQGVQSLAPNADVLSFSAANVSGTRGDQSPPSTVNYRRPGHHLYDYRWRFWAVPDYTLRLVNPSVGADLPFVLWNTWPQNETLASVVVSDPLILDPALEPTNIIRANEYFGTSFQILDGTNDINETMTFNFTSEGVVITVIGSLASTFNIVPDVPVREDWEFLTDIIRSHNGSEQRIALRKNPRLSTQFRVDILDFKDRRDQYITTFRNMGLSATVPLYQHATKVTQATGPGSSKVYFDPNRTQMQVGQQIVVIDPRTDAFQLGLVASIDADGANISGSFADSIDERWFVFPGAAFLLKNDSGISTYKLTGKLNIQGEGIGSVSLIRQGNTATLTTLNGLPIMERRIKAGHLSELFDRRREVIDNETGLPDIKRYSETYSDVGGVKKWEINRYDGAAEDYMRKFIDTARGAQKSWLLPTWMPDLILAATPADGAAQLLVQSTNYVDFFHIPEPWNYLMIQYNDGSPITYHEVTNAQIVDGNTEITINPALALGDNEAIDMISFLNRVRGEDRITRTHYEQMTEYSWSVRTASE